MTAGCAVGSVLGCHTPDEVVVVVDDGNGAREAGMTRSRLQIELEGGG